MKDIIKNINYYINNLLNKIHNKFYKKFSIQSQSEILIVKPDRIGDFILWINSLKYLIEIYKNYKITIVCDKSVVQLLNIIENLNIKVISIDRSKFLFNLYYRWEILKILKEKSYESVINPLYSRDFLSESLVESIIGKQKIGIKGDNSNLKNKLLEKYNKNYTNLYEIPSSCIHEIEINDYFIKKVCKTSNNISKMKLNFDKSNKVEGRYIVIFLGSSNRKKQWNIEKFIKIGHEFSKKYKIVLLGGNSEIELGKVYEKNFPDKKNLMNLIGHTSMAEVCNYIYNSILVITNDTFSVHLATLLEKESICLVGGGHFGRFLPYPKNSFTVLPKIIFEKMECFGCQWKCKYSSVPYQCINLLEEKKVSKKIKEILLKKGEEI